MTQIYDIDQDDDINRQNAEEQVEKEIQKTIVRVCLSITCGCLLRRQVLVKLVPKCRPDGSTFNSMQNLHTPETGKHQDQVKVLIERTASSLDDNALRCCLFQYSKIILSSVFNMQ